MKVSSSPLGSLALCIAAAVTTKTTAAATLPCNLNVEVQVALDAFTPVSAADIDDLLPPLEKALADANRYINALGPQSAAVWYDHMLWNPMQREIAKGRMADSVPIASTLARLSEPYRELESAPVYTFRESLGRFHQLLTYYQSPHSLQKGRFKDLLGSISRMTAGRALESLTPSELRAVGHATHELEVLGRASKVTTCVRKAFSFGNGRLSMSERLVGAVAFCNPNSGQRPPVGALVRKMNKTLDELVRHPLAQRGFVGPLTRWSSTEIDMIATLDLTTAQHLGAPVHPAALPSQADIEVAVHESGLANLLSATVAGVQLTHEDLAFYLRLIFEDIPPALRPDPAQDSWHFTFADKDPLLFSFREGNLRTFLRLKEFTRRSLNPPDPPEEVFLGSLELEFDLQHSGPVAVRSEPAISDRLTKFAIEKFSSLLLEAWQYPRKSLPELPRLEGVFPPLYLRDLTLENGWLRAGWAFDGCH